MNLNLALRAILIAKWRSQYERKHEQNVKEQEDI
jgi:hypothetical protein